MYFPSTSTSKLKFSDRSFRHSFNRMWNSLLTNLISFSQLQSSFTMTSLFHFSLIRFTLNHAISLYLSLSLSLSLSCLTTHLFSLSYPFNYISTLTCLITFSLSTVHIDTRVSTPEYTNMRYFVGLYRAF